jgi:hypothetical protein
MCIRKSIETESKFDVVKILTQLPPYASKEIANEPESAPES